MNTKAAIGLLYNDKSVLGIICHNDGYVQGVGKTLLKHYNIIEDIHLLIELGTLTELKDTIETTQVSINNRSHRYVKAMLFQSVDDFERYYEIADYFYLFDSNCWIYKHSMAENKPYESLEFALR